MLSLPDFKYKQLLVHFAGEFGEKIHFQNSNIVISDSSRKTLVKHSLYRLFALFVIGETSITTPFLANASKFGFPIILLKRNLSPFMQINCQPNGNTGIRRLQYTLEAQSRIRIAKEIVRKKIASQVALLSSSPYKSIKDAVAISKIRSLDLNGQTDIKGIMGIEGTASREYFSAWFRNLSWSARIPKLKTDYINLLLDIGYSYLFNFVDAMAMLYGFDSYAGFLHQLFFHRKSLICDLMEPFRYIVDRRIRKLHEQSQIATSDFFLQDGRWQVEYPASRKYTEFFLKDILAEKESIFRFVKEFYRTIINEQPKCF